MSRISQASSPKFLGIDIYKNLSWNVHIENPSKKTAYANFVVLLDVIKYEFLELILLDGLCKGCTSCN